MAGGAKGKVPPQKSGGSIAKAKRSDTKVADGSATKARKPKAVKSSKADDDALIASLISCAAGSEKTLKNEEPEDDLDMDLVAALAAEACIPSQHGGCDNSETGEPLPSSYLEDQEDHLSLEDDELAGSGGPHDDGVMITSLIDSAAEKNLDMELVAALAADAVCTPTSTSAKGAQTSFADDDTLERSANDSALAADVENFMNGSCESFALEAQEESESRGERSVSSAHTQKRDEKGGEVNKERIAEGADSTAATAGRDSGGNWQQDCSLRREATPSTSSASPTSATSGGIATATTSTTPQTTTTATLAATKLQPEGVCA